MVGSNVRIGGNLQNLSYNWIEGTIVSYVTNSVAMKIDHDIDQVHAGPQIF